MARPSKFKQEYTKQVYSLTLLGLIDAELAKVFDVSTVTLNAWKKKYPAFLNSIKKGKDIADANVAVSLYQRACGYSHPEERIFCNDGDVTKVKTTKHYPPDTAAAFIWLKNRQPSRWRDKTELFDDDMPEPKSIKVTIVDGRKPKAE